MSHSEHVTGAGHGRLTAIALAALKGLVKQYRAWRSQREAIATLSHLDDRLLKDIGISRSDVDWVVAHGRFAEPASDEGVAARRPPGSGSAKRAGLGC